MEYINLTKKIKLQVVGDKDEVNRVYRFIRDGQYAQYRALNLLMGTLTAKYYECDRNIKDDNFICFQKKIYKKAYLDHLFNEIEFATGVDTISAVTQTVKKDFSSALKNGLAKGERTITNYKRTYPLLTRGRNINLYSDKDTCFIEENVLSNDYDFYIKWVNKINFKCILGNPHRSKELRATLLRVLNKDYKIQGSKIKIQNNSIFLYLTVLMPVQGYVPVNGCCVAVKLNNDVMAHCSCNEASDKTYDVGNADELIRVKELLSKQRTRIQSNLKFAKGGHGRNRKLRAYEKLSKRESSFATTYNHSLSKEIINYAIKNKAETIILEKLNNENNLLSTEWAYSQLQSLIDYKAKKHGINTAYVELENDDLKNKDNWRLLPIKMLELI